MKLGLALDLGRRPTSRCRSRACSSRSGSASTRCGAPRPTAPTPSRRSRTSRRTRGASGSARRSMQVAARTPAATAMALATLDGSRAAAARSCGLGLSGPQIVEGWYGQPWGRPTRACATTSRSCARCSRARGPSRTTGARSRCPTRARARSGIGKPLRSILHTNPRIPIWLGTAAPRTVRLTAEIADGWLPFGFVPGMLTVYRPWLEEGFRRAGGGKSLASFEIQAGDARRRSRTTSPARRARRSR